jgi:acyl carrier protein
VLDADLEPAPIGVPGQLYIAGVGLARGYVGRPDLTADRFVPCPYGEPGERMYATGDVVRWRSDGNLVFLGRVDRQVKIRGLRIELGEIEAALVAHPDVRQAAVVVHEAPGGPQLAAYVVPSDGTVDRGSLTSHLSERLPLHMVPPTTAVLDALPLTPSGKLDEARLPKPKPDVRPHVAPATPTESALAEIWHELLDVDAATLSVHDSFFGLGGNSLLATQLISRVRDAYGISLDPRELFTHPLLHQLAGLVDEAETAALGDDELAEVEDELSGLSEEEIDRMLAAEQQGER